MLPANSRYDQLFGKLNADLRGLALKILPPREGMDVLHIYRGCARKCSLMPLRVQRERGVELTAWER
jgi:hypothetical protein